MTAAAHDVVMFEEAQALARRRRARIWLPVGIVVTILLALLSIAYYDYKTMRADALALSQGVIANLQSRIETEVAAYLKPIPQMIRLSVDVLTDQQLSDVQRQLIEPLGVGIVESTPQLTALFIGSPKGEFFMVRRLRDGDEEGLETKWILKPQDESDTLQMRITRRGPEGDVVSDGLVPWDGYDPRTRPWFEGATEVQSVFWTDVYPFFTGQTAGITGSKAHRDPAGELVAVVGADVQLESLSRFLNTLAVGKTGIALIVDNEGRVIAHPSADLMTQDAKGQLRLMRVADLEDPVVQRAFDRFQVEGHGRRDFELASRRYISSASSLHHLLQRDWSILVVVPEDDFVGFVVTNVGSTLGMGLGVIALAALLAGLLIRQGLRTDREAMRILEREAQLDAQSDAFGSLAMQSRLFDSTGAQVLAPVTEALARASRVRRASLWQLVPGGESLRCIDCFDQETEGHTQGTVVTRSEHPGLFSLLEAGETVREIDASRNDRLASLYHGYLSPLGCLALLSVPVVARGGFTGVLWLEDGGRRREWPKQLESFVRAVANLLAMRESVGERTTTAPPGTAAVAEAQATTQVEQRPVGERSSELCDIDPGLGTRRAAAFTARLAQRAEQAGVASADVIDRLAVMALRLTDAVALAEPVSGSGKESAIAYLIRELETAASTHGLSYLKFLTDQVVAAVDPQEDVTQGAARLADFALAVQHICERLFASKRTHLAFRIGMDLGPVISTVVGTERRTFNLWGEAAHMAATMADTSLPGRIQVTETVYHALNKHYVFQLRGHHYLEGVGEFSTYLLSGRL